MNYVIGTLRLFGIIALFVGLGLLLGDSPGVGVVVLILCGLYWRWDQRNWQPMDYEPEAVDPKTLRWCKTCRHYRKVRRWSDRFGENGPLPPDELPCRIPDQTRDVWDRYFRLSSSYRTLYPKDCPKWMKR